MKILLITQYFPPDLSAGSFRMSSLVDEISNSLTNDDMLEVYTAYPHRYDDYRKQKIFNKGINVKLNRIKLLKHKNNKFLQILNYVIFFLWVIFKTRNKKYNKIFTTSSKLMTSFLGSIISKNKKIKFYCEFRDNFIQSIDLIGGVYNSKVIIYILNKIEKFICMNCHKLNLVSKGFNEYFLKKYPNLIITNYTNGIDDLYLNFDFKKNIKNLSSQKTILYVGNIGFGQALEKILPYMAKQINSNYQFIIIGDGSSKKLLIDKVDDLNLKNIRIVSPMNREKLNTYYKDADILFLHLNDHESSRFVLPSKIFEYAATNKPILAGLNGYSKIFCRDNIDGCYLFDSCNVDQALFQLSRIKEYFLDRDIFINLFLRKNISSKLAKEIINL